MANARKRYKRVMGEIPEEMHEKIALFNKITDRPLNVSKVIELCIEQAVKKIDESLINYAAESEGKNGIMSDEIYYAIKKDIDEKMLGPKAIHKHFVEMLKKESPLDDIIIKLILYPIDKVEYDKSKQIFFYAKGIYCFALAPSYSDNNFDEAYLHSSKPE